jgi:Na+/melibiose symporter-like transporter
MIVIEKLYSLKSRSFLCGVFICLQMITGSMLVLLSFPMLFAPCPGCRDMNTIINPWLMAVYYGALITVFQGGWAVVQISHLAMIPDLTPTQQGRAELTAIRYGYIQIYFAVRGHYLYPLLCSVCCEEDMVIIRLAETHSNQWQNY